MAVTSSGCYPKGFTIYKHEFIEKVVSASSYIKSKAKDDSKMFGADGVDIF